ncbi:MAG: hypothetical protein WC875_04295, partial [Candidatus Absconditabacterales bacterium]
PDALKVTTGDNGNILYTMYRSYDSFGYRWKQGDICFVDDFYIYNIVIRQYTVSEVISILNSFTFLN